jgi:hypothetical protein
VLNGDEPSRRDRQTTRLAFVVQVKPDDPIDVGEWKGIQQCRIHNAEQPCGRGNADGQGDDSRDGKTGTPAEDPQRKPEIYGEDVQQSTSLSGERTEYTTPE